MDLGGGSELVVIPMLRGADVVYLVPHSHGQAGDGGWRVVVPYAYSQGSLVPLCSSHYVAGPTHPTLALGVAGDSPSRVSIPIQKRPRAAGSLQGTLWGHGVLAPVPSSRPGTAEEGRKHHGEAYRETLCAPKLATRPGWFSCLLPQWKIGTE